jgi:hypothetical protein
VNGHGNERVASYEPSTLVVDVAMVLAQRGIETTIVSKDLPQAHQAAWTLLGLFGVEPDTSRCPCLACGGAALHLARISFVPADDAREPGGCDNGTGHIDPIMCEEGMP